MNMCVCMCLDRNNCITIFNQYIFGICLDDFKYVYILYSTNLIYYFLFFTNFKNSIIMFFNTVISFLRYTSVKLNNLDY